jgi:hypothetical protein
VTISTKDIGYYSPIDRIIYLSFVSTPSYIVPALRTRLIEENLLSPTLERIV